MPEKTGEKIEDGVCPSLLAVSFSAPPNRWMTYVPDKSNILRPISGGLPGGAVTGIAVDGMRLYPEDSPLVVQPDLLVDFASGTCQ